MFVPKYIALGHNCSRQMFVEINHNIFLANYYSHLSRIAGSIESCDCRFQYLAVLA